MTRKVLLACGVLSSVLYAAMTVVAARQWPEYSSMSQTISELSAVDAPTRSAWMLPGAIYMLLVALFGWGVVLSAARNRRLRIVGFSILIYGSLGLAWPFAPMHQREVLAAGGGTFSDTMHLVLSAVTVTLMLVALGYGTVGLGPRFGGFTIASLVILAVCAALTFLEAPEVSRNGPTPWIGLWERINLGVFLVWIIVLAVALWPGVPRPTGRQLPS